MANSTDKKPSSDGLTSRTLLALVGNVASPAVSFITAPILAHSLGVTGRGEVAAATAPAFLLISTATLGLPEAITYASARHPKFARRVLRHGILLTLLPASVATGLLFLGRTWLSSGSQQVADLIAWSCIALLPGLVLNLWRASAASHNQWGRIALERAVSAVSRLLALIALTILGSLTVNTAAAVIVITQLAGGLAYVGIFRHSKRTLKYNLVPQELKLPSIARYGSSVWVGSIAGVLLSRLDQTLMAPLSSAYQLGIYAVAVSVAELSLVMNASLGQVLFTHFSTDSKNTNEAATLSRLSTVLVLGGSILVGAISPFFIPILYGNEFSPSISPALILLIAVVIGNPGSVAGSALSGMGRPGLRSISLIIAALINIGLLIVLVPSHGAVGAALATLVGNFVCGNLNLVFLQRISDSRFLDFYKFRAGDLLFIISKLKIFILKLVRIQS